MPPHATSSRRAPRRRTRSSPWRAGLAALAALTAACSADGGGTSLDDRTPEATADLSQVASPVSVADSTSTSELAWQRCELLSAGVTVSHPERWLREESPMRSCVTFAPPGADPDEEGVTVRSDRTELGAAVAELLTDDWRLLHGVGLPPGISLTEPGGEVVRLVPIGDGSTLRFTGRAGRSLDDAGIAALVVHMATSVRPVRAAATPDAGAGPGGAAPEPIERTPGSRVRPEPGNVALTFDDGPHPTWTPIILELLDQYDATATFFVVGSTAERHPDLVRQIVDRGHSVQNHTQDHERLTLIDDGGVREQLRGADRAITAAGAPRPRCMRPPYGAVDERVRGLTAGGDQDVVLWNIDTLDWRNPGVDGIIAAAVQAKDRDIVLFHDGPGDRSETVAALPWVLEFLASSGFGFQRLCADPPPG